MVKMKTKKAPPVVETPIKLDISHGILPEGHAYQRIPKLEPTKFPWPIKDRSVEEAYSAYIFHRIPKNLRQAFMEEVWRVLKPGGKIIIVAPYWSSPRSYQDPTAEWPPVTEATFFYYSKDWLKAQNDLNGQKCDFEFPPIVSYAMEPETAGRNDDTRNHWMKHYVNSVNDIYVTLTKKP